MENQLEDKKIKILKKQLFWLKIEVGVLMALTLLDIIYSLFGGYIWIIVRK